MAITYSKASLESRTKLLPIHSAEWVIDKEAASSATGLHVFAVTGEGKLLLAESEGDFSYEEWDEACARAEDAVMEKLHAGDMEVDGEDVGRKARKWLLNVVTEAKS